MCFAVHDGWRLDDEAVGGCLRVEVDDCVMVEFVTDESAAISDRFEWDLFTFGGPTCCPACDEDNGVCASEGLRSRDEDVCDEDNGVRACEVLRSRDEITCDEDNGVCASV